jgi:hypothetical protein
VFSEDLDEYESQAQMKLYEEFRDVLKLFRYAVSSETAYYLSNHVEVRPSMEQGGAYFMVTLEDAWVYDKSRVDRFVPRVEIFSLHDVVVEQLRTDSDTDLADEGELS